MKLKATWIAQDVCDWLPTIQEMRVLHCFNHVWNFIDQDERIISVVTPNIGRGPFHIVVPVGVLPPLYPSQQILCERNKIIIGDWSIDLTFAQIWDSSLQWNMETAPSTLLEICRTILQNSPRGLAHIYFNSSTIENTFENIAHKQVMRGAQQITHGIQQQDRYKLAVSVEMIAGQGIGLTPSGDDWLLGCVAALHRYGHDEIAQVIAVKAAPGTTSLSAAWLLMAGKGKFSDPWHKLALARTIKQIEEGVQNILCQGATSGADALIGFVQVLDILIEE